MIDNNPYVKEYIHRINKVIDFVERNLDKEIRLEKIADIASFSPFHFHRIFTAMMGETPNGFIKRKRIEKAASMLINNLDVSITDITYTCGFGSTSSFCKAFKDHYKINTKEFRKKYNVHYSKNGQSNSKNDQSNQISDSYLWHIKNQNQKIIMETIIQVTNMPELDVLYCRHMGQFDQIGKAYNKLFNWAGPRGLLDFPETKTLTVYHDDPSVTQIENVRQSACITVNHDVKSEGEIGKMKVPGGNYAIGRFEINDKEFNQAWDTMCIWLTESGYQPADGYPYELYHNDHTQHPERKFILDICIPVKPL